MLLWMTVVSLLYYIYINKRGGTLSGSMGNDECTMKALEKNKGTQINKKIA